MLLGDDILRKDESGTGVDHTGGDTVQLTRGHDALSSNNNRPKNNILHDTPLFD